MTTSLSSQLTQQVYSVSDLASSRLDSYLTRPFGTPALHHQISAIDLLEAVQIIRCNLENYCKSDTCELTLNMAQSLFSILNLAELQLKRIK